MKTVGIHVVLMLFGSLVAFSDPVEIGQGDVLARTRSHELVKQAQLNQEIKKGILSVESGWNGAQIAFAPSIRYDDSTGKMLVAETGVGMELLFPLGVTQAERERKLQAGELVNIAELELEDALGKAYSELYGLYATCYIAQENIAVVDKEAELARLRLDLTNQKTSRGLASIADQVDAEAEYQAASEKAIQARLDARLAWFELASAAGFETAKPGLGMSTNDHAQTMESIVFDLPHILAPSIDAIIKVVPQPGILMTMAKDRSPLVQAQLQKLAVARRALENHSSLDLNFTPKFLYMTPSVSASLGYGTATGAINLGTTWNPYTNPDAVASKTQSPDNSFTISVGISGNIHPNGPAEKAILLAAAQLEERKLDAIEQGIELSIRSRYATYLKAKDSLAEAERVSRLTVESAAATMTRRLLGQLSPEDEAANEVTLIRASYSVKKASIALGQAYLGMIAAANAWDLTNVSNNGVNP